MAKMGRPKSESPKLKTVGVRLTDEQHKELKEYASKHNQTITEAVSEGIQLLLKKT